MLYYVIASEFPLRPVTSNQVIEDTVVTYTWENWVQMCFLAILIVFHVGIDGV